MRCSACRTDMHCVDHNTKKHNEKRKICGYKDIGSICRKA